jgi:hypothetical protein
MTDVWVGVRVGVGEAVTVCKVGEAVEVLVGVYDGVGVISVGVLDAVAVGKVGEAVSALVGVYEGVRVGALPVSITS